MRRALIATAGTAAGLVALLSYKSSDAVNTSQTKVNVAPASSSSPTTPSTQPSTQPSSDQTPTTTGPATTTPSALKVVTGSDIQYNYGEIQLRVTTDQGKITNIEVAHDSSPDPRSQSINDQAIPILTREALAAQGLNFDVVSGATFTSDAFAQALQSAIDPSGA